jgi:hypothetical protein
MRLADEFGLNDQERQQPLPSRAQPSVDTQNRQLIDTSKPAIN